jgi:hypothetical protein
VGTPGEEDAGVGWGENLGGEEDGPAFCLGETPRVVYLSGRANERVAGLGLPPLLSREQRTAVPLEVEERQEVVGVRARKGSRGAEPWGVPPGAHERRPRDRLEGEDGRPAPASAAIAPLVRSSQTTPPSGIRPADRPVPRNHSPIINRRSSYNAETSALLSAGPAPDTGQGS